MLETVHISSLSASIVHPREVFNSAIFSNAACITVYQNHPSDECEPCGEDVSITKHLEQTGDLIGILLLNHLIIGIKGYVSLFFRKGELYKSNSSSERMEIQRFGRFRC
ncbi:DNA repair protein [Exiguobacterium sp. PBE]|nr:DNA repair protein [Exiguobacterium sp. PBE]